jgi:hypothetical protein
VSVERRTEPFLAILDAISAGRPSTNGHGNGDAAEGHAARSDRWPAPPGESAFYGLAGRIVRTIEPHSEADPVALLAQTLVVAGNLIGRGPHVPVEADEHHANLNVCLVGETSKARKGTSYGQVERLATAADAGWRDRVESGLTSGEGLIWRLRDESPDSEEDGGQRDKRLLVFESEFANVLRVLERSGNRLSATVRDAWDGRPLGTLTRTTAAKATGAHISIIGHITADELRRYLDRTETANGFGNRFLWLCVRRSKALPEGGRMHLVDVAPLVEDLRDAVRHACTLGRIERDPDAAELWRHVYPALSDGCPGLFGALTGRAEAQVTRLSLLDRSPIISRDHLDAALALWEYSERSVEHIFGRALGDPIADSILHALEAASPRALTRTDIRDLVGGRIPATDIDRALALLANRRLAHKHTRHTGGRPAEHWQLGAQPNEEAR